MAVVKVYTPALHSEQGETTKMLVDEWLETRGISARNTREIVMVGDGIFAVEVYVRDEKGRIKIQQIDNGPYPVTSVVRVTDDGLPQWWPLD